MVRSTICNNKFINFYNPTYRSTASLNYVIIRIQFFTFLLTLYPRELLRPHSNVSKTFGTKER